MSRKHSVPGGGKYIPMDCFVCQSRARSEWSALTDGELRLLNAAKICRLYESGEIIFHEGEPCRGVYCVESGLVGIRKTDGNGNSILLGRMGYPGDMLGYRPFLADEPHRGTGETLEPSVICFIQAATVRQLLDSNPALGLQFLQRASRAMGEAEEEYFESLSLSARARLAHLLMVLNDRHGKPDGERGFVLELPFSRRDLAALVGTRPESVSRLIREMAKDGVVRFSRRRVHVADTDRLLAEFAVDDHH